MKGDFTRSSFQRLRRYSRVFMQQGRVQIDADWNEQASIVLHYLRSLAKHVVGPHGAAGESSFRIELPSKPEDGFVIKAGDYYVDGILCENPADAIYTGQADYPLPEAEKLQLNQTYLVYLDVWERHIGAIENDAIREVALGGMDTCTRGQVVWQAKTTRHFWDGNQLPQDLAGLNIGDERSWREWLEKNWASALLGHWQPEKLGSLKARAKENQDEQPCCSAPDARYRGLENQLYRVEIHRGGKADEVDKASFKWSRENGSVTFPILQLAGSEAIVEHLGRDSRFGLERGDWVEVLDDDAVLQERAYPLLEVLAVDADNRRVSLSGSPGIVVDESLSKHPLLRRWDHKKSIFADKQVTQFEGALLIVEAVGDEHWIALEDGIRIQFQADAGRYRSGDYWLIPARTAIGDIQWPQGADGKAMAVSPHGVEHGYAPLAIITTDANANTAVSADLRKKIKPVADY